MARKTLKENQILDIIQQYKSGKTPKEIGELHGIYNNSVTRLLRKRGIVRDQQIKITDEEVKFIIENYQQGMSSEIIADKIGRDGTTVCRVLKKHNINIRPATQNKRQYKIWEDFFENIDTEEKAYFLGLIYADGNLSKRGNCIKLTLKDKDILEVWSKTIYGFSKIYEELRTDEDGVVRTYYSVGIYAEKMHRDLCKLGCTPKKTFSIRFPEFMKKHHLCNHFIRGYFDGDGCISLGEDKLGVVDITSNIDFIEDCIIVINNLLNIPCYFGIRKNKPNTGFLQIAAQANVEKFLQYIYKDSTVYLPRKRIKSEEFYNLLSNKNKEKYPLDKKYGTFFIPKFNGLELNIDNISKMSLNEKEQAAKFIFDFYRTGGFPYAELTDDELIGEFSVLKSFDTSKIEQDNKLSIANYVGTPIFKHFAPQFFEMKSPYQNKLSMVEAFNNDKLLQQVIKNRLDNNYNIHGNMIKQGLRNTRAAFMGSIFNTTVAKFLYQRYTINNDIIYDYSMGFGQRLLGALSLPYNVKYIGVDPFDKSVKSNNDIYNFYNKNIPLLNKEVVIMQAGSEEYCPEEYHNKVNFAFSSPPYFNLENYENNARQAYSSGYNKFINEWWDRTVVNIDKLLTKNGIFAINIMENLNKFNIAEDMCNIIKKYGYLQIERYDLRLSKNKMYNNQHIEKLEPIFIFQKQ